MSLLRFRAFVSASAWAIRAALSSAVGLRASRAAFAMRDHARSVAIESGAKVVGESGQRSAPATEVRVLRLQWRRGST